MRQFALITWLLAVGSAWAGQVTVVVTEQGGKPLGDVVVHLGLADRQPYWFGSVSRYRRGRTSSSGQVVFRGVPAGRYATQVRVQSPHHVAPESNPFQSSLEISVPETGEVVQEVQVARGFELRAELVSNDDAIPSSALTLVHVDTGFQLEMQFYGRQRELQRTLVHGRWRVRYDAPPGALLVENQVDGWPHETHEVTLEVDEAKQRVDTTWIVEVQARAHGKVAAASGCGTGTVEAHLLEAGEWLTAARARGGSSYEVVPTHVDPYSCYFDLPLPSGRWELRPVGDRITSWSPDPVLVELGVGGREHSWIDIELDDGQDGLSMAVVVLDADGRVLPGAAVEVPAVIGDQARAHLKTTGPRGDVLFGGLVKGPREVLAGDVDHVDARVEAKDWELQPSDFDTGAWRKKRVELQLERGAAIRAQALDEHDAPVSGIRLVVTALDELPMLVRSDELKKQRQQREIVTDNDGRAWLQGFFPGRYHLKAEAVGHAKSRRHVRVFHGDEGGDDELEIVITGDEVVPLTLSVLPAARLTAQLRCREGEELPTVASVLVLPGQLAWDVASARLRGEEHEAEDDVAVLREPEQVLDGPGRDELAVGPLEPGHWLLAVKPRGFARWTLPWGTERLIEAESIPVEAGETVDLGTLEIDCTPRLEVRPRMLSGELPDLRIAELEAAWRPVDEERRHFGEGNQLPVRFERDRIVLLENPQGEVDLDIAVHHPHFLPFPWVVIEERRTLEPGSLHVHEPVVERLGGAIVVRDGSDGFAKAVLQRDDLVVSGVTQELEDGVALLPGLEPGRFTVRLCEDRECERVTRTWDDVAVEPGVTTELSAVIP
ncbi:MAG: carboxypeptidase-like regulatory domain-containing protein [Acidobacteriota bacterium]